MKPQYSVEDINKIQSTIHNTNMAINYIKSVRSEEETRKEMDFDVELLVDVPPVQFQQSGAEYFLSEQRKKRLNRFLIKVMKEEIAERVDFLADQGVAFEGE